MQQMYRLGRGRAGPIIRPYAENPHYSYEYLSRYGRILIYYGAWGTEYGPGGAMMWDAAEVRDTQRAYFLRLPLLISTTHTK